MRGGSHESDLRPIASALRPRNYTPASRAHGVAAKDRTHMPSATRLRFLAGIVTSGLVIAFMLLDAGMKLVPLDIVMTATTELGYPPSPSLVRGIGIVALACTVLY